jgi:hypothetical protein
LDCNEETLKWLKTNASESSNIKLLNF